MATILPFSSIQDNLKVKDQAKKALLDTNILIAFSHEIHKFHDETLVLFEMLKRKDIKIYSNVITRSEFIDYQRRLIITEALTTLSQQIREVLSNDMIARKLKAHRANVHKRAEQGNPLVLNDSTIKDFKKMLSFSIRNVENVWLKFCHDNFSGKLERSFEIIFRLMKLNYLSLRKEDRSSEIVEDVSWSDMYKTSEKSGLSINDSMILNIFESTDIPFLMTTDFDLVYAAALSPVSKIVFCPDDQYRDYKDKYFHLL